MDFLQLEKRRKIMGRSIKLGHCVCDPQKPCPCPIFKEIDVCECAGEKRKVPVSSEKIKLTDHVRGAGCASKIGKKDLSDALRGLPEVVDDRILVGSSSGDDAGVMVLSQDDQQALILTVDVFAPSVDDPYTFGQVAAANSLSDVYAMGGKPQSALSIIGFPIYTLPNQVMHEILRGGVDKMKEAGIAVIGGHSINDEEVKCGFAVVGTCDKDKAVCNTGAKKGDSIVLTKPLGIGITAFAAQIGRAETKSISEITESMCMLNKVAADIMSNYTVNAGTDVTGYSLLGHMSEIVRKSSVEVEIDFDAIPLFRQVKSLARQEVIPGAVERNLEAVNPKMLNLDSVTEAQQHILFCPETSGGLLLFMPEEQAHDYVSQLQSEGITAASIIGRVTKDCSEPMIKVVTEQADQFTPLKVQPLQTEKTESEEHEASCCDSSVKSVQDSCCCSPPEPEESSCCSSPNSEETSYCCSPQETASCCGPIEEAEENYSATSAFDAYIQSVTAPGAINQKHKKLMALSLSLATMCEPCVKINSRASKEAGASDAEVAEAVAMGIAFGGAPSAMLYNSIKHKL